MEIREYLQAKRRWLPALVAAPLVAASATAGVVHFMPPETTAQVTAYVPPALTNSDSQIGLYIARLNQGLLLTSVQTDIAAKAQIDDEDLVELKVERSGQSDQFLVSVITTVPAERAVAVAETVTKVGTAFVARQALSGADVSTEIARQNFTKAQNDMFAYQDQIGDLDPNVTYANVSRQLLAPGRGVSISALQTQQKELVGQVRRYNELKAIVQTTSGSLGSAQSQSTQRGAEVTAAENGSQILYAAISKDPIPGLRYIEPAGLAAVLGFIAVLGMSLLPDLLRAASGAMGAPAPGTNQSTAPTRVVSILGPDGTAQLVPPGSLPPSPNGVPVAAASGRASDPADGDDTGDLDVKDRA